MKVAFIVSGFPVLSETFILNEITGLLDLGYDVQIFAEANPGEKKVHPDIEKYQLMKRVHYFDIPNNKIKRLLKAIYLIITNFNKNPIKMLKTLNIFKYGKFALSLRLLYAFTTFVNAGKEFNIVHCHFGPNGIIGAALKEIGVIKSKVITTFHGYDMSKFILNHKKNIYKNLFSQGDLFLPVSENWKKKLIKLGCDEKKVMVHHMGVDLRKFKFCKKKFPYKKPINILTIGRLVEKKGHEYAIKSIAKIIYKYKKNIVYIIAGDGPLRNKLKFLSSQLGISNYVKFVGKVKQNEVLKLYQQSHIFILPSITSSEGEQEGIPVVLLEAQAAGLPVISTYHSGIPEAVINGQSGFLVPERDVDALTKKLMYLINHPEIWPRMGRCGRMFIEKEYNINRLNQKLSKIYQDLINRDFKSERKNISYYLRNKGSI